MTDLERGVTVTCIVVAVQYSTFVYVSTVTGTTTCVMGWARCVREQGCKESKVRVWGTQCPEGVCMQAGAWTKIKNTSFNGPCFVRL
ncbi:hypothetical protein M408DRAFT_329188, partial [Serendipita vermifera MAFF 305830]